MATTLTDEQRLLRDTVTGLAADLRAAPEAIELQRARRESADTVAELGLLTMRWPEQADGADASTADVVLVAEAFGRAPAVVPFAGPVLAAELLLRSGADAQALAAIAHAGPLTVALDPDTLAIASDDPLAWDAAGAARAVGVSTSEGAPSVVVRSVGDDERPSADLTRVIRSVAPGTSDAVGPAAAEELDRWLAFALTVVSADLVGTMAGALDLAVAYAKDRRQFGQAIGAFQALAHLLADAHVRVEAARSATGHAAWAVDHLPADAALLAARVAKAYAARVALGVTEVGVQVHGAIGTTWESRCHLFLRRAVAGQALLGDEQATLDAIAATRLGER